MQITSQTWRDLLASGAPLQARATIGGVAYTDISAPVITRALMQDRLGVGNVVSASLALAVRGAAGIPRSAAVVIEVRLNDGQAASEWLPQGTFYISRRMRDPVTGLLALECYDALLKANAVWTPSAGAWPRTMAAVTAELAALLGVTLDSRTVIPTGAAYAMSEPAEGTTIRDALGVVAQAAGGNWVMTPAGLLRLVRVGESGDTVDVTGVVGGIDVGQAGTVTGVRSTVDGVVTLIGDDTGIVVDVSIAPMIAAEMAEDLIGQAYAPFHLSGAIYDPAAELGDGVRAGAGGEVISALCSEQAAYGPAFRGDIAAPDPGEVTDEYPYIGSAERTLALAKAAAVEAVDRLDDELTQQEIFNRLTDDGAAQGLLLYNGQLYINASYINAGYLSADHIQGGTLTLGGQGNQNGVLQVLDANGNMITKISNNGIQTNSSDNSLMSEYTAGRLLFYVYDGSQYSQVFTILPDVNTGIRLQSNYANDIIIDSNDAPIFLRAIYNSNVAASINIGNGNVYIKGNVILLSPLDVQYGGTGATDPAAARANLGVTPANIGAKAVQSAVSDPTASGTAVAFIDSISQNAQGVISPTKKTVQSASQSAAGLMSAADKKKLDGIAAGAQVNSVTGVKGNAESSYRTGNINLTPANIGAVAKSGDTMTGPLKWASGTALPAASSLQYFLGIDAFADGGTTHYITAANLLAAIGAVAKSGDTMTGTLKTTAGTGINVAPSGARAYIYLSPQGDYASDVRFQCAGFAKWSLSSRDSSADYFLGLFNHTTGIWTARFFKDDTIQFAKPLPVGSGGTGATTAAGARTNLGTSLYISSNTSATVYNQLNALNTSEAITAMLTETAAKYLSSDSNNNNPKVTHAVDGVIRKASATSYVFAMFDGYGYAYRWQATVTASGATVGNCYRFAGTLI